MKVTTSRALEFACHSKACAPPPAGSGGSSKGGTVTGKMSPAERKATPGYQARVLKHADKLLKGKDLSASPKVIKQHLDNAAGKFKSAEHARTVMNQLARKPNRSIFEEARLKQAVAYSQRSGKTRPTG